jgi:hypothetical protein
VSAAANCYAPDARTVLSEPAFLFLRRIVCADYTAMWGRVLVTAIVLAASCAVCCHTPRGGAAALAVVAAVSAASAASAAKPAQDVLGGGVGGTVLRAEGKRAAAAPLLKTWSAQNPVTAKSVTCAGLVSYAGASYTPEEVMAIADVRARSADGEYVPPTLVRDLAVNTPYRTGLATCKGGIAHSHLGQRKLMLGEVQFLAEHGHRATLVLYIGAAPGTHIPLLADLFPEHEFHLWDGRPFAPAAVNHPRIKTFQKMFFEEQARAYEGKKCLLVSDIRSATSSDETITRDNKIQAEWVRQVRPAAFSLKFHPPYGNPTSKYRYLDGEAQLQAWSPSRSSETRLFAVAPEDPAAPWPERDWDVAAYDARLHRFNIADRDWGEVALGAGLEDAKGGDRCADCAIERRIWDAYLATPWGRAGKKTVAYLADQFSARPGWKLSGLAGHTSLSRAPDPNGQWTARYAAIKDARGAMTARWLGLRRGNATANKKAQRGKTPHKSR